MKSTIICFLLATSALAQNGYPYQGGNLPMDHQDDIYSRDFPTLVYNFEQLRRDQPPQVEARQEDLGKYRNRPRPSTTAPPPMLNFPSDVPEVKILPEPVYPYIRGGSTIKPYIGQNWNQIINQHLPATIPPPPTTPAWMDLSDTLKSRNVNQPHYSSAQQVPQEPQVPMYHEEVPETPAEPAYSGYPQYSGVEYVPTTTTTTEAPYAHYAQHVAVDPYAQHSVPRPHHSRGQHKFNWNDVQPTEQRQSVITTPAPLPYNPPARKVPSSIPTLTPWSGDGFGK